MKAAIHTDIKVTRAMAKKGRKVTSHSTHRVKRHPTSPRNMKGFR